MYFSAEVRAGVVAQPALPAMTVELTAPAVPNQELPLRAIPSRSNAGFTLLEILAALAVLGLVLLALSQGTQFGLTAWHTQSATSARHNELEAVDRTLRLLIERTVSSDRVKNRGPLLGGSTGLDVVTVLPPNSASLPDGTVEARLEVNSAHQLILRWKPMPHATWIRPPPQQQEVLLRGVLKLEVAYWQMALGGGGVWLRGWTSADPPSSIRIRIIFPPGDLRHWPDIVTGPRIDQALSWFRLYNRVTVLIIRSRSFNPGVSIHVA